MNRILLIAFICVSFTSCSKEFSLEGQGINIIDNEPGGLNFFLHTNGTEISVNIYNDGYPVPVFERNKYFEYEISAGDLQDNISYIIELQHHSVPAADTVDFVIEGFTAMPGTKNYSLNGIAVSVNDVGTKKQILRMTKTGVRYTFTPY